MERPRRQCSNMSAQSEDFDDDNPTKLESTERFSRFFHACPGGARNWENQLQKQTKKLSLATKQQQHIEVATTINSSTDLRAPVPIATEQKPDVTGNDIFTLTIRTPEHSQRAAGHNNGCNKVDSSSSSNSNKEFLSRQKQEIPMLQLSGDSAYM